MGRMIDGTWITEDRFLVEKGKFQREETQIRDKISGRPGSRFPPQPGRYHLYVSLACPWAHRTLIMRRLKGLEDFISFDVVSPLMYDMGWPLEQTPSYSPKGLVDPKYLYQIYQAHDGNYSGRVTVPLLWDRESDQAVSNESSEIIRMFNSEFAPWAKDQYDYYPAALQKQIDEINGVIYGGINNGVYKVGFAATQAAYEEEVTKLFKTLDMVEYRLSKSRYLVGDKLTEADIRLYVTLIRFDAVYVGHFKCNLCRISDYPNLTGYLKELYQIPAFKETTDFTHIKSHYYQSHKFLNPSGIVPSGPLLDLDSPHGRGANQ